MWATFLTEECRWTDKSFSCLLPSYLRSQRYKKCQISKKSTVLQCPTLFYKFGGFDPTLGVFFKEN